MSDDDWQFDPLVDVAADPSTFPMVWYELQRVRDTEHRDYDDLDFDGQMAAWQISAAIANRIPFAVQARMCLDGSWIRIVERSKAAVIAVVDVDYREEAWHAGKVLALEDIANHCGHRFPGNPHHG